MHPKFYYFPLIFLFVVKYFSAYAQVKRSDIDLQVCLENFNIKVDEIIRTQDSQQLGAKYLNEVDLGSREECLRLCCETEECDVFVFEEKKSGSCYLFHCGPPENFKCKFTHHANYSSAILAINRHTTDLESQMRHEQDLTNLRKQEKESVLFKQMIIQPQIIPTTTTTSKPETLVFPKLNVRKCSRFQFECRSTSECIAIYNACDGIPQCADGSDEGPELECPNNSIITPAPPIPTPMKNPGDFIKYENKIPLPFFPHKNVIQKTIYQQAQLPRESQPLPQFVPKTDPNFIRPNEEPNINYRIQYNMDLQPHLPPIQGEMNWIPQQTNQIVPQMNPQNVVQPVQIQQPVVEIREPPKQIEQPIQVKHKSERPISHHVHHEDYPNIGYYHADASDLQDGVSKTPTGATLSVAVGLIITALMALMFGCRLKMVRRRIRREGKGFSHDADFLVNGMYL